MLIKRSTVDLEKVEATDVPAWVGFGKEKKEADTEETEPVSSEKEQN
jgi:hypothetical protein